MQTKQKDKLVGITTMFQVRPDGTVWAYSNWRSKGFRFRQLSVAVDNYGYPTIRTYRNGKRVTYRVHRLVARFYLPPQPSPEHEVRHLDGNKQNNISSNLAWGTKKENAADRSLHGHTSHGPAHGDAIREAMRRNDTYGWAAKENRNA